MDVARRVGTTSLLMELAMGRVEKSPFGEEGVSALREAVVRGAKTFGHAPEDQSHRPKRRAHRLQIPGTVTGIRRRSRSCDGILRRRSTVWTWCQDASVAGFVQTETPLEAPITIRRTGLPGESCER